MRIDQTKLGSRVSRLYASWDHTILVVSTQFRLLLANLDRIVSPLLLAVCCTLSTLLARVQESRLPNHTWNGWVAGIRCTKLCVACAAHPNSAFQVARNNPGTLLIKQGFVSAFHDCLCTSRPQMILLEGLVEQMILSPFLSVAFTLMSLEGSLHSKVSHAWAWSPREAQRVSRPFRGSPDLKG